MPHQVFLGGAAGLTTWRRDIAIPALQSAAVSYYDPQLPLHAWTPAREAEEMRAKDEAAVLLFVINHETRAVATVAEVAYYMGLGRPLALAIADLPPNANLYNQPLQAPEIDDLNRGRLFLRTMARAHNIPVFDDIPAAVQYAIQLAQPRQTLDTLRAILADIHFPNCEFHLEPAAGHFLLQIRTPEWHGRKWHIDPASTRAEVVRTALKAALTWQEHETRESFTYRGKPIHGPHFEI
jgi:hypothetical protein